MLKVTIFFAIVIYATLQNVEFLSHLYQEYCSCRIWDVLVRVPK